MARLTCTLTLLVAFSVADATGSLGVPVVAAQQQTMDCPSGCNGPTDERWNNALQACIGYPSTSCQEGCTCWYGFLLSIQTRNGQTAAIKGWFHIYFDKEGKATVGTPGPLARHRVQVGDPIYRINRRIPKRESFARYTQAEPAKYAEARWDTQGRLWLRLWR